MSNLFEDGFLYSGDSKFEWVLESGDVEWTEEDIDEFMHFNGGDEDE